MISISKIKIVRQSKSLGFRGTSTRLGKQPSKVGRSVNILIILIDDSFKDDSHKLCYIIIKMKLK